MQSVSRKRAKVRRVLNNKCSQKHEPEQKIKRPPNKFFLYQRVMQSKCRDACVKAVADASADGESTSADASVVQAIRDTFLHLDEASFQEKLAPMLDERPWHQMFGMNKFPVNQQLAKLIGLSWRLERAEVKAHYTMKQEATAAAHKQQFPNYVYRPVHATFKKSSGTGLKARGPGCTRSLLEKKLPKKRVKRQRQTSLPLLTTMVDKVEDAQ
jgi:hypothetical protein